jgi:hypothetical protein
MLSVAYETIMLNVNMRIGFMLSVIILSVVILYVVILNVVVPGGSD